MAQVGRKSDRAISVAVVVFITRFPDLIVLEFSAGNAKQAACHRVIDIDINEIQGVEGGVVAKLSSSWRNRSTVTLADECCTQLTGGGVREVEHAHGENARSAIGKILFQSGAHNGKGYLIPGDIGLVE